MIASVLVEIRTEHLPNTNLEHYRCTSFLGVVVANISVFSGETEVNNELKIVVI
jgi:hypothetical protein